MTGRHKRQRGFTAIELIVSMSVVAVLLGLLMPILGGTRKASNALLCATQLRSMAVALRSYADDNNALPVSSVFIGISVRTGSPPPPDRVRLTLPRAIANYLDTRPPFLRDDGSVSDLSPWTCPAERWFDGTGASGHQFFPDGFSYGYGGVAVIPNPQTFRLYDVPDEPGLGRATLRYFEEQPSRVILFDENPYHANDPASTVGPDGRTHARFDGSVQIH